MRHRLCGGRARLAEKRADEQQRDDRRIGGDEGWDTGLFHPLHDARPTRRIPARFRGHTTAMATTSRILLFDIDGTLVTTGGAGAAPRRRAVEDLRGLPADIRKFTRPGM